MLNPNAQSFADISNQAVLFHGENALGQFLFGNGSPMATHVYPRLEEAITRFGRRIDTRDAEFKFSGSWASGLADSAAGKPYAPVRSHGKQAVLEYGHGYLKGMLERTMGAKS